MARQFTGRKIKRNHSNALPQIVVAYNVETMETTRTNDGLRRSHEFRCGHAYYGRYRTGGLSGVRSVDIASPLAFWKLADKLTSPQRTVWVIGYKILDDLVCSDITGKFERSELLIDWPRTKRTRETNDDLEPHAQGLCVLENPPTILACRNIATGGRIVFVDACNWFSLPFTDIAQGCNLKRISEPGPDAPIGDWKARCQRDAEIMFLAFGQLMQWVQKENMGMFRYTAAAQSMAAFRHRFMHHDILVHDNKEAKALERRGYYGGRTEVFRLGKIDETCHQLDVSSLFPSIMRDSFVPFLLHRYEYSPAFSSYLPSINWADCIAEVEIETKDAVYPDRCGKVTTYPTGYFRTTLAGSELEHAYHAGCVRAIKSFAEYKTAILFRNFVDDLWAMRQEYKRQGNQLYDIFTKRILNSLYGKFGQKAPRWQNVYGTFAALPWSRWTEASPGGGKRIEYRSVGWQIQRHTEYEELEGSFIAISAFITAAARRRMDWLRWVAQPRNVYYQGVDSLIVNDTGYQRLKDYGYVSDNELGKLRLQLSFNTGEIYGCNDYRIGQKTVVSGRSLDWEISDAGKVLQRKAASVSYLFHGLPVNSIYDELEPWERISQYQKGTPQANGWVSPLVRTNVLGEIERKARDANNI